MSIDIHIYKFKTEAVRKVRPRVKYKDLAERCKILWAVEARMQIERLQPEEQELEDRWRSLADHMKLQSFIIRDLRHPQSFKKAYTHWKQRQVFVESELADLFKETKRLVVHKFNTRDKGVK